MFEKFTAPSRQTVVLASEEAEELGHEYVGPEHLLLGLAREGHGLAGEVLRSLHISGNLIRQRIVDMIGQGQHAQSGIPPFTNGAKKVLELALRESLKLGHDYVGTEHLLLGLIEDSDSVAAQIIVSSGHSLSEVRDRVMQVLGNPPDSPPGPSLQEPETDENPEERSLFTQALTMTMRAPDIASVADSFGTQEIEQYISRRRVRIWSFVSEERGRMRSAAAELEAISDVIIPKAEAAARRNLPELLALHDEAAQQEERIAEPLAQGTALAGVLRQIRGRGLTTDEAQRSDQVMAEMQDTIRQGGAWLERVRGARQSPGSGDPGQMTESFEPSRKPLAAGVLSRLRGLVPSTARNPAARYQQTSELLLSIRKLRHEVGVERKRASLQLSQAALKVAKQDEGFRSAKARTDAASEALVSSLQDAMLPEVRVYIGRNC